MSISHSDEALNWFHLWARERIVTQPLRHVLCQQNEISWDILRTDLIHPVCSGNKFFKLRYYLEEAIKGGYRKVQTFGGAWSNHIVATAYAAQACGLQSIGYIRGEAPATWSQTLLDAKDFGMQLVFLERKTFDEQVSQNPDLLIHQAAPASLPATPPPQPYPIPMGGYGEKGARGAADILDYTARKDYTHIFCAAGTGTMAAGLSMKAGEAEVWAINVVRGNDLSTNIFALAPGARIQIINDFHFGGYAKTSQALMDFMNQFHQQNSIPTDFVYTARLMYAIEALLQKKSIPRGSRILAIHSGGLQGNKSLKKGQLSY